MRCKNIFNWKTKNCALVVIIFSIALSLWAQDFRKVSWGMSEAEVKEIEGGDCESRTDPIDPNGNLLIYRRTVIDEDVMLKYSFVDGQLYRAEYCFKKDVRLRVVDALRNKYGEGEISWPREDDPLFSMAGRWFKGRTVILLYAQLGGSEERPWIQPTTRVLYQDLEYFKKQRSRDSQEF